MQKDIDILAIGEAMIEFNQRSAGADSYAMGFGGDTSNCAIAAARLGAKTAYLSRVGSDVFGRRLMALWAEESVSAEGVIVERVEKRRHQRRERPGTEHRQSRPIVRRESADPAVENY